jgi:hypothetical protein
MRIIALEDEQYHYLLHTFQTYTRSGMEPKELGIAASTFHHLQEAREIPVDPGVHLGHAKIADIGPQGIALEVGVPEGETAPTS